MKPPYRETSEDQAFGTADPGQANVLTDNNFFMQLLQKPQSLEELPPSNQAETFGKRVLLRPSRLFMCHRSAKLVVN